MRSWLQDRDLVTKGDFMIVGYLELRALEVGNQVDGADALERDSHPTGRDHAAIPRKRSET